MEGFITFIGLLSVAVAALAILSIAAMRMGADSRPLDREPRGWWIGGI